MRTELSELLKHPQGVKVAVLGAGVSGKSAFRLLQMLGANATLFDKLTHQLNVDDVLGVEELNDDTDLLGYELIILSPGIPRKSPAVAAAISKNIPVANEIDLGFSHLHKCRFIGVTGTNGKSTTTAMIGDVLKTVDEKSFVGGNLGRPLCDAVMRKEEPSLCVLELSSYQLETLSVLKLDVAVVTHLKPDHLDRYDDEEAYYRAKNQIFSLLKPEGFSVVNQKDKNSALFLHPNKNRVDFNRPLGFDLPNIIGAHNQENAAAAFAACSALGIDARIIKEALEKFKGIPHRLELLGELNGVRWFNDSKATNVDASIVAVESFSNGVHLILGGLGKGASYNPLVNACMGRVKSVYAIGEESEKIEKAFSGQFPLVLSGNLENAVKLATQRASSGDVILLAPACASFDQYLNYEARGDHLRQLFRSYGGGK